MKTKISLLNLQNKFFPNKFIRKYGTTNYYLLYCIPSKNDGLVYGSNMVEINSEYIIAKQHETIPIIKKEFRDPQGFILGCLFLPMTKYMTFAITISASRKICNTV